MGNLMGPSTASYHQTLWNSIKPNCHLTENLVLCGCRLRLGRKYVTPEAAARARDRAMLAIFGRSSDVLTKRKDPLNFPLSTYPPEVPAWTLQHPTRDPLLLCWVIC